MSSTRQYLVTQLRTTIPDFKQVMGAAELTLKTLRETTFTTPSAFVLHEENRAGENTAMNGVSQFVKSYWVIFIVVRNLRDPRGGDSMDVIDNLRAQVRTSLLNHIVPDSQSGMEFIGGKLELQSDDILLWKDTYMSYHNIQQFKPK